MLASSASYAFIDSHTAGHPTRVILSGISPLRGESVLAMRDDFKARFDHLRPALLHEPAGHAAMVGLIPVPSRVADYGAFFISSYVYLDMCGHGTIGYAKTLAANGQITAADGSSFTLETPAGIVTVGLDWSDDGTLASVRVKNVPSYVAIDGLIVEVPDIGTVKADIVYGGMWYALVDARALGLDLHDGTVGQALAKGAAIKASIKDALRAHSAAVGTDASASVLFYADEARQSETLSARHILVLEANKFDRSPCGTGTSARLAQLVHQGRIGDGQSYRALNVLGVPFEAKIAERTCIGDKPAVIAEISGQAFITTMGTIFKEKNDPLHGGFLCR
ncbi:proline racemase [Arboricoccus pini]|uniref:Proline racemase n=1 Tax=Arboricoccus pini TaxID=1963835 RepID=A0A212RL32_9PROT|nr:proline racemase family protein [Arboricoccus pini]SNB73151.1 proline racemase [Arboricoccus pini]